MSTAFIRDSPSVSDNNTILDSTNDQPANPNDTQTPNENQTTSCRNKSWRPTKFTRGEKCLFTHLVATFAMLLLLFIIFVVHLFVVKHHGNQMFEGLVRRRAAVQQSDNIPVGVVYVLPDYYMCNCLLLRPSWSVAPAHCVAARSDPDLANALPKWRIMFGSNTGSEEYLETMIARSVPHPHFNRDDFQNNIGLFQHEDSIPLISETHISGVALSDDTLQSNSAELKLIGWEDSWHLHGHVAQHSVLPMPMEKCKPYVSPVVDLRAYEHCVRMRTAKRNATTSPGAVLAMKAEFVGMFAWGDSRGRGLPFVILDLAHYKDWILHVVEI